jgi:hypothetical protein
MDPAVLVQPQHRLIQKIGWTGKSLSEAGIRWTKPVGLTVIRRLHDQGVHLHLANQIQRTSWMTSVKIACIWLNALLRIVALHKASQFPTQKTTCEGKRLFTMDKA